MTHTLLRIEASARSESSVTRKLADEVTAKLSPTKTILRDLNAAIPHVDEAWVSANFTPADQRSTEQAERLALSDALIAELRAADTIVIASPIYNFGVPASLKSWFDQVARAGVTFKYTENGPVGLLAGKRAVLVIASGGTEVDSPIDFATPWLRQAMNFIGITDVQVVRSDRQMVDAEASQQRAANDIANLAA